MRFSEQQIDIYRRWSEEGVRNNDIFMVLIVCGIIFSILFLVQWFRDRKIS